MQAQFALSSLATSAILSIATTPTDPLQTNAIGVIMQIIPLPTALTKTIADNRQTSTDWDLCQSLANLVILGESSARAAAEEFPMGITNRLGQLALAVRILEQGGASAQSKVRNLVEEALSGKLGPLPAAASDELLKARRIAGDNITSGARQ